MTGYPVFLAYYVRLSPACPEKKKKKKYVGEAERQKRKCMKWACGRQPFYQLFQEIAGITSALPPAF